jgi:uncharacterized protein
VARSVVRGLEALLLLLALTAFAGCAGHASRTERARSALDAGNLREALDLYNEELEVDSEKELPKDVGGANALLLLDRAVILQALRNHQASQRDLGIADKEIDLLDLKRGTLDDIGKFVFSDDSGPYRAPAYERLMINTMNMVNYLVQRDLSGARVEARRLAVMQDYIKNFDADSGSLIGPGSYLAGFVFEKSGNLDEALRYYDEALQYASAPSLLATLRALAKRSSYRTPRIEQALAGAPSDSESEADADHADVLVVVGYGRVPAKLAERLPIGLALTYASGALSPSDHSRANELAAQGLVTWVNFPRLGKPRGQWGQPSFLVDARPVELDPAVAIDQEAKKAWDRGEGTVIASAITRTISRVVAGEVTRKASGGGTLGLLLSLGTQATLTAVDTPDTRSWVTLPARIAIGRLRVKPGKHRVELGARERRESFELDLKPRDWAVLNLTVLR